MKLSGDDVQDALLAVNILITELQCQRRRVPPWLLELGRRFDAKSLMSRTGHENDGAAAPLEADDLLVLLVGSQEAADILGLSTRTVRRLRTDLDGEIVSGRLMFKRSTVEEYARARETRGAESVGEVRGIPADPAA